MSECTFSARQSDHVSDINMVKTQCRIWPAPFCHCSLAQAVIPCNTSPPASFLTTIAPSLTFCSIGMLKDPVDQTPSPPFPSFHHASRFSLRSLVFQGPNLWRPGVRGPTLSGGEDGWGKGWAWGKKGWAAHKGVPQTRGHWLQTIFGLSSRCLNTFFLFYFVNLTTKPGGFQPGGHKINLRGHEMINRR